MNETFTPEQNGGTCSSGKMGGTIRETEIEATRSAFPLTRSIRAGTPPDSRPPNRLEESQGAGVNRAVTSGIFPSDPAEQEKPNGLNPFP